MNSLTDVPLRRPIYSVLARGFVFSPIPTVMKSLLIGTLLSFSAALAQDAICGNGETELSVVINDGDTFNYKTSKKGKYSNNMDCFVYYELGESCEEMMLSCNKINIKNNKACTNGDMLLITNDEGEKTVCGKKKKFKFTSSSDMLLEFTSNNKKTGAGAKGCKVTCSKPATSAPTTAAPTTTPGDRSYIAGISYSFDSTNSPFCAGTLVSSSWVLTTASCAFADNSVMRANKISVVLGENSSNKEVVG